MEAKNLKQIRKLAKLSQEKFGRQLYASRSQIRDWEQGIYKIPTWAQENIRREFIHLGETLVVDEAPIPYSNLDKGSRKILLDAEELLDEADEEIKDNLKRLIRLMRRIPKTQSKRSGIKGLKTG